MREARVRISERQKNDGEMEKGREQRQLNRERRIIQRHLERVAAVARERIRRLKLREEYGLEI